MLLQVPPPLLPLPLPMHTLPAITLVPSKTWCETQQVHHAVAPAFHPPAPPSSPPKPRQVLTFARSLHQTSSTSKPSHTAMKPSPPPSGSMSCMSVNLRRGLRRRMHMQPFTTLRTKNCVTWQRRRLGHARSAK